MPSDAVGRRVRRDSEAESNATARSMISPPVAKALADLTSSGALVNPKDKKGYRLPDWKRETPSLF